MSNILITGATHALSQKIARNLLTGYQVYFADAQPIPDLLLTSGKYLQIPYPAIPSFVHELLALAIDKNIELIIPLKYKEISALSSSKTLFEEYGIKLAVPAIHELEEISYMVNPPANLTPLVIIDGECITKSLSGNDLSLENASSGLCIPGDSGEELLYCCIK